MYLCANVCINVLVCMAHFAAFFLSMKFFSVSDKTKNDYSRRKWRRCDKGESEKKPHKHRNTNSRTVRKILEYRYNNAQTHFQEALIMQLDVTQSNCQTNYVFFSFLLFYYLQDGKQIENKNTCSSRQMKCSTSEA